MVLLQKKSSITSKSVQKRVVGRHGRGRPFVPPLCWGAATSTPSVRRCTSKIARRRRSCGQRLPRNLTPPSHTIRRVICETGTMKRNTRKSDVYPTFRASPEPHRCLTSECWLCGVFATGLPSLSKSYFAFWQLSGWQKVHKTFFFILWFFVIRQIKIIARYWLIR